VGPNKSNKSDQVKTTGTKTQVIATREGIVHVTQRSKRHHGMAAVLDSDDIVREQVGGFTNFLREYAVVGLAVGFVVGQQANTVAKQLVASFIEPWLQAIFGTSLETAHATIHHAHDPKPILVPWGQFVYVLIEFLVVAVVIYAVVKLLRLDKLKKVKEEKK
jgi:large conductance mechanosensitive channel